MQPAELAVAVEAAKAAGEILRTYFRDGVTMRSKDVANLVSDADVEAERAIVEVIRARCPGHEVLAEEAHQGDAGAEHLWVVDPLDGTANFAHKIPHFAVSIAHRFRGVTDVGVIYNPITDDWFTATKGGGAFHGDLKCRVSSHDSLGEIMVAFGLPYERGPIMEATLAATAEFIRARCHGARRMGTASLDLCYVGMGLFGAYFEYVLSPWDYAAGQLFVEEAGGLVTDCLGQPITLTKTSLLATNREVHDPSLAITRTFFP